MSDYGSPDKAEDFEKLLAYSPVHKCGGARRWQQAVPCHDPDHGRPRRQVPRWATAAVCSLQHGPTPKRGTLHGRVVPLHSHKLLATLQHELCHPDSPQRNPLISRCARRQQHPCKRGGGALGISQQAWCRIETRAGHGAGKPTDMVISEVADCLAFAAEVTGASFQR